MKSLVLHVEREALLTSKPYITCRQLIDFIASYSDNELTAILDARHKADA